MVVVWCDTQTGLKRGFWHIVLRETRPGSEAARLLSIPGQEIKTHPVWEASCLCLSQVLIIPWLIKTAWPSCDLLLHSLLGVFMPTVTCQNSDNFVIVPPPPKGSALVISQCLGNSWPHKDSIKGNQTQARCLPDTPQSDFSKSTQSSLSTVAQWATHPLLFLGWRKLWKLMQEKQDQAKAKPHTTSFHKKGKKKPNSLLSQQSHLSSAIPDAGKTSRR